MPEILFSHKMIACHPIKLQNFDICHFLYADDLVIVSESDLGLQTSLDRLHNYSCAKQLAVSINKSKTDSDSQPDFLHRKFLKRLMGVSNAYPNLATYGETGEIPLSLKGCRLLCHECLCCSMLRMKIALTGILKCFFFLRVYIREDIFRRNSTFDPYVFLKMF